MLDQEEVKKIIYQSCHRGCKETDFILGDFAKARVEQFNLETLILYQKLILEDDWNIYNWVVGRQEIPNQYLDLIGEIKEFSRQQFLS